ncbi:MAG: hypothetical protein Q7T65_06345 [Thiobacillus sp.]|nr:hypothetical protein [Thiobacillus sp.]
MKTTHIQNFTQVNEKQEKYCSGMACAAEVLALKIKAAHPLCTKGVSQMKQHALHSRNTLLTVLMAGVAGVGFSTAVTATTAAEVAANPIVSAEAQARTYVAMHMSATGSAFHNAPGQRWETRGADRVAERMGTSVDGLEQSTAPGTEAAGEAIATAKRGMH